MNINYDQIAKAAGVDREIVKKVLIAFSYSGGPPVVDYKGLLLSLLAGMGLHDHMGDCAEDVFEVVKRMGIDLPESIDLQQLRGYLGYHHGAVSLWGGGSTFDADSDCPGCFNATYIEDACTCGDDAEV